MEHQKGCSNKLKSSFGSLLVLPIVHLWLLDNVYEDHGAIIAHRWPVLTDISHLFKSSVDHSDYFRLPLQQVEHTSSRARLDSLMYTSVHTHLNIYIHRQEISICGEVVIFLAMNGHTTEPHIPINDNHKFTRTHGTHSIKKSPRVTSSSVFSYQVRWTTGGGFGAVTGLCIMLPIGPCIWEGLHACVWRVHQSGPAVCVSMAVCDHWDLRVALIEICGFAAHRPETHPIASSEVKRETRRLV